MIHQHATSRSKKDISESFVIFLIGFVQFVDILDFMMVMPLGPDFSKDLDFDIAKMGYVSAVYAFAAGLSGLLFSKILDRFDRKSLLLTSMLGLALATLAGGFAYDANSLLITRFLAGSFGGPATAAAFAIISDLIEPRRRGAAMGKVWGAFSIASVIGVPLGLEVARLSSWRLPFYGVSSMAIVAALLIYFKLPSIRKHLDENEHKESVTYVSLLSKKRYLLSYLSISLSTMAAFMIIPYISPQLQINLHLPRDQISMQYFVGGTLSFFAMRFAGYMVDQYNATITTALGTLLLSMTLIGGFIYPGIAHYIPIVYIFAPFMIGMSIRNVSSSTNFSKVPSLYDRAGFMSLNSCFQHFFSSIGSLLASYIIYETPAGYLANMPYLAVLSLVLFTLTIPLTYLIEKSIRS
jgi:predicted MFS family arabinose efflux permease